MGHCMSRRSSLTDFKISPRHQISQFQWDKSRLGSRRHSPNLGQVVKMWNVYVDQADIVGLNLFSPHMLDEEVTVAIFNLHNEPLDKNAVFARHLHLVHFALDFCIRMIIDNQFHQCTMALSSLGSIHADMGISPEVMVKFARSAVSAIRQACLNANRHFTRTDFEVIRDAIIVITQIIIHGIKRHNIKISYLYLYGRGQFRVTRFMSHGRQLRYIDNRSHKSIMSLANSMKSED